MAIDVPYPQFVTQNGLGFTRGQCALDKNGRVLRPNDLLGQTELIVRNLEPVLEQVEVSQDQLVRAVVYYLNDGSVNEAAYLRRLGEMLAGLQTVSIVAVPLPHFYYDGMMVEIDFMFADDAAEPVHAVNACPPFADAVIADEFIYVSQVTGVSAPGDGGGLLTQLETIRERLAAVLAGAGGELDDIVKLTTCFVGGAFDWSRIAEARSGWFQGFYPVISDVGLSRLGPEGAMIAVDAIAVRRAAPNHSRREPVHVAGGGHWPIDLPHPQAIRMADLVITGGQLAVGQDRAVQAPYALDDQTTVVMDQLGRVLEAAGASFGDVIKATTYYRGGANADDLHGNMVIRSGYYAEPGPASTGVPISVLPAPAAMISVEVTAVR